MKSCWHCSQAIEHAMLNGGTCSCITCAKDVAAGPCAACSGRKKSSDLSAMLDKYGIDVRDSANWIVVKPEAPAHPYRKLRLSRQLEAEGLM